MSSTRWSMPIAGRWLVPLLLLLGALFLLGLRFAYEMRDIDRDVTQLEIRRLQERLGVEQSRLESQKDLGNPLMLRRLVGSLALHQGLDRAYLVSADGQVLASLSRRDIGRPIKAVLTDGDAVPALLDALATLPGQAGIQVTRPGAEPLITGLVSVDDGSHLLVQADLNYPLAVRLVSVRSQLLREALLVLSLVGLLAVLLHVLWFRRAQRLAQALGDIGSGRLSVRAGLKGRDELALIGRAADGMAERLQADEEQIRRLSSVVSRSPLIAIEWRNAPGWPVVYVSDAVSQWGYTPADLLAGHAVYNDLIHPDDVGWINRDIETYFAHGPDEYRMQYRIRCADGRWAWVDDRTTLERDEQGAVQTISGILLDITEQRETQLLQLEQAELLRTFYELPFLGMAISSPTDKRWLQVNDRLCEILGYTREELLRMTWAEMTPPGDLERNVDLFDELLAGKRNGYQMHKRFVRKDGSQVQVELIVRATRTPEGAVKQVFATIQDVTERMRAARALSDLTDMLEQAESVSRLGSWAADLETNRLSLSAQHFRNMGLEPADRPPDEASYLARVHPDDRVRVAEDLVRVRAGMEVPDLVYRTNPEHGPMRWLRRTAQRIDRSAEHLAPRYIGTLQDITESVAVEERLRQTNLELERRVHERTQQLSEANRELEAFSYSVSHDLKAPLRGIDGYSQLLVEEYANRLDEEGLHFVQRIRQGVRQMGALIEDLLEYSRMERRDMGHETVAIEPLVRQILDGYRADIEQSGAVVQLTVEPMTLALDREGLSVALRNLIGNALKFSRSNKAPAIEIGARTEAGRRILWVRDNGVGFDMKYHDRIFGIFQRLHRPEDFPGTGVGLALVSKAAQRMGGSVRAESQLGAGATFFLEFPA